MKNVSSKIEYIIYDSPASLDQADRRLLAMAMETTHSAYAPYSEFHVGAAVLLENGEIICGSNQENAAYPSGLCAERVALFYASSRFPEVPVQSIAITARFNDGKDFLEVSPCGNCRQVMAEYEQRFQKPIRLIMTAGNGKVMVIPDAKTLLPLLFTKENVTRKGK